jgi:aconitate hydratase
MDLELDISTVTSSLAGPKRPQDRIELTQLKEEFHAMYSRPVAEGGFGREAATFDSSDAKVSLNGSGEIELGHGSILIAAITSCTNTSNPGVMLAAGLLARKAVERGMKTHPAVKTSLGPGSRVVSDYLENTGLQEYLDQLGFHLVGYGCTTCIGNSGPLAKSLEEAVVNNDLVTASVLSGNRNFEARIHQNIKANFLMSPPLVVAFAIAGRMDIDMASEPLGQDAEGNDVFLKDIWPSQNEVREVLQAALKPKIFQKLYSDFADQNPKWNEIPANTGDVFEWDESSTYIQDPPFFENFGLEPGSIEEISGAKVLGLFGDSVTTDHISPAGAIKADSPAGRFLQENNVEPVDFNSFGSRRGNDRIMTRGTFGNVRIKNQMVPGTEGGVTKYNGETTSIYEAAMAHRGNGTPLIVLAGTEYGTGSSRDWAAKGTLLLGVRAVVAASFERIHRSNLVGMGVLPLQFKDGASPQSLGFDGTETFDVVGLDERLRPQSELTLRVTKDGESTDIPVLCRIDTPIEVDYYRHGGILPYVLRQLAG